MEGLIRARSLLGFSECVKRLGGDPFPIFHATGIPADATADPQAWISFAACLRAYDLASRVLHDPAFGVKHATSRDLSYLGPLILYARHASNLRAAVEDFRRYFYIHNTGYRSVMEGGPDLSTLTYYMPDKLRKTAPQWVESIMCSTQRVITHIMGGEEDVGLECILFQHAPLRPISEYEDVYGVPVLFEQKADGAVIDNRNLDLPVPHHDTMIHEFMERYLQDRLPQIDNNLVAATRVLLETLIPAAQGKLEIVAEHLHIHPRTLQRRLQETGFSFSELLDDQRRLMAKRLLNEGNLPFVNIAFVLGYAEQSAFNHAFERWYGIAPSKWLKNRGAANPPPP
ncbi:MAG: AraC family transcriptional regulator ligand-binding domain-containing protein [Pseudomonadota bacterium]